MIIKVCLCPQRFHNAYLVDAAIFELLTANNCYCLKYCDNDTANIVKLTNIRLKVL